MQKTVTLRANAKLNLALSVEGTYPDGFHKIDTIFQSVSVFDTLTLRQKCDTQIDVQMKNTAHIQFNAAKRAAELFVKQFGTHGAHIIIEKQIPFAGGMGGSGADAAGVIAGMCELYGVPKSEAETLAKKLGSDTLFLLRGGLARGQGRGDELTFFSAPKLHFVVLVSPSGLLAKDVYNTFDQNDFGENPNIKLLLDNLISGHLPLQDECKNALQKAALSLSPHAHEVFEKAKKISPISMTGSGSCFFAICQDFEESQRKCQNFKNAGLTAFTCTSEQSGIEFC